MVVTDDISNKRRPRGPNGYKVAPRNRLQLRATAQELLPFLRENGCFDTEYGPDFLDASFLLENILHRAGYSFHVDDSGKLKETAAFAVPDKKLIVIRQDIYENLERHDPFARYTVVHEFAHIYLEHAVSLHRGAILGEHKWWEDSEWQANNLAAEMLMPVDAVKRLGGKPLLLQSDCGVSSRAATYRIDTLLKEGVL